VSLQANLLFPIKERALRTLERMNLQRSQKIKIKQRTRKKTKRIYLPNLIILSSLMLLFRMELNSLPKTSLELLPKQLVSL
jgi:hypothetical protein